ncbi:MAG: bifunctional histidinol-phosphatase/imidazoleglycerol-phosphate dehydratase HisB [Bacteroidaceae bacterium]|nr:bifunctional histidinol-phosphatase/imidazoleglycerol-phosphate dehydratase HisB [Bacteroidaceae bacterium]MBQ3992124.1 bifunctional histidinol-phosphatase/imidazoleglycerol-phosphate dehydratase HisB [Bacteroidaceae bacterium]
MQKKILFIDRDGTILREPADEQIDSFQKFEFMPGAIGALSFLRRHTDYLFVLVSNQDGLGTASYPEADFWPTQNLMLDVLASEGVRFDAIHIDRSFPQDNLPTRKPGTAMLTEYMQGDYDLTHSWVIGDRPTDRQLAENLGCQSILLSDTTDWQRICEVVFAGERTADVTRTTSETDISVRLNLDGDGKADIQTGLGFFDHMLEQIARHGMIDLYVRCRGDLHVDEHHTIEDVGIALGECLAKALADKRGIERYGFSLPMDDCLCQVSLDFGGRPWLVWDAEFHRERVGDVPTEMFRHFFKSLSDSARINLNVKAEGENEHHKAEGIFKAFARSVRMAVRRDVYHFQLPSSKGVL